MKNLFLLVFFSTLTFAKSPNPNKALDLARKNLRDCKIAFSTLKDKNIKIEDHCKTQIATVKTEALKLGKKETEGADYVKLDLGKVKAAGLSLETESETPASTTSSGSTPVVTADESKTLEDNSNKTETQNATASDSNDVSVPPSANVQLEGGYFPEVFDTKKNSATKPNAVAVTNPALGLTVKNEKVLLDKKSEASISLGKKNESKFKIIKEFNSTTLIEDPKKTGKLLAERRAAASTAETPVTSTNELPVQNASASTSLSELDVIHVEKSKCVNPTWYPGIPARVISVDSPCAKKTKDGKSLERINACIKYVECKSGEKTFLRQALCSPDECDGEDEARKCVDSDYAIYVDPDKNKTKNYIKEKDKKGLIEDNASHKVIKR